MTERRQLIRRSRTSWTLASQEIEERLLNTGDRNYTSNRFTVSSPENMI